MKISKETRGQVEKLGKIPRQKLWLFVVHHEQEFSSLQVVFTDISRTKKPVMASLDLPVTVFSIAILKYLMAWVLKLAGVASKDLK